jgi:hypothetical protein
MSNTLTAILTQILARGMMPLRERVMMTRLVNTDYSTEAGRKGQTIDIPLSASMTATAVTPAATPSAPTDLTPTTAQISLTNWQHASFGLNDQEMGRIRADQDFIPLQMEEAFKALATKINTSVFANYKDVYGYVGTAATTPFGAGVEVMSATDIRKTLNKQLCPRDNRRAVLDYDAEAAALNLAQFSDAEKRGSATTKTEGEIGKVFGINWYGDDGVPSHTAGTVTSSPVAGDTAIGSATVTVSGGSGNYLEGDIITIAGDTQTYVVGATCDSSSGTLAIDPPLKVAITGGSAPAITLKASHVVNLAFHRDAFGLAMRAPDMGLKELAGVNLGNVISSVTLADPVTKLIMRLEYIRGYKMLIWDIDCLWGTTCVSPERACRLAG